MSDHCIVTAPVAEQLIEARQTHLLPRLFASVSIPREVHNELLANEKTREWANNPDAGILVRDVDKLDAGAQAMLERNDITKGEAQAISLAKEFSSRGDHCFVLSDNQQIEEYLYSNPKDIKEFTAGLWSVNCMADEKKLVDLDWVRPELEKICPLNGPTERRVELYCEHKHQKELSQARSIGQVH